MSAAVSFPRIERTNVEFLRQSAFWGKINGKWFIKSKHDFVIELQTPIHNKKKEKKTVKLYISPTLGRHSPRTDVWLITSSL